MIRTPGAAGTLGMSITYGVYLNGPRKGNTQGALKEQQLVTTENFDNEQPAKTQLGIYIHMSFLAKDNISGVQTCSGFLVKKMLCGFNYEFKTEKEESSQK